MKPRFLNSVIHFKLNKCVFFRSQLLKELDLNVDVDVAYLAAQTPPIKIFPTPNTSDLPYNRQLAALEADYLKYYEYRGDMTYNENMKRSIVKTGPATSGDSTCLYRVCRDKTRFCETRIKDDVLILGKILASMIERTSEMEKHLEQVLLDNGEKELPNWDELYEEISHNAGAAAVPGGSDEKKEAPKKANGRKVPTAARKPRGKKIAAMKQNLIAAAPHQLNDQNQPEMTQEQAQKFLAQMIIARSHSHGNRIHSNSDHSNAAHHKDAKSN